MGGDRGVETTVPASLQSLKQHGNLNLILVGDEAVLTQHLRKSRGGMSDRVEVVHASEIVEMGERPSLALRNKKDSSMRVAINTVKEGRADACVSAGNTGALMATARFVLKMLPGIDRPAICASFPGTGGQTHMLDLGANIDSSSEELFRFAVMGSVLASAVDNKDTPTVALLNVGEEEIKGNDRVKQTASILAESDLNYYGFVEGDDIYKGRVDVIVCDGFVGNIALKASEGVARMIQTMARQEIKRSPISMLSAFIAGPVLRGLSKRVDPRRYNGASLLGLRGIVVKSHGGADALSFRSAIDEALLEVEKDVPSRISHLLEGQLLED